MKIPDFFPWTIDEKVGLAVPVWNWGVDASKAQNFAPANGGGISKVNTVSITNDPVFGPCPDVTNAASGWLSVPHHASLNFTTKFLMMCWVYTRGYGGNNQGGIFCKVNTSVGYQLRVVSTGQLNFFRDLTGHAVSVGLVLNKWQLLGSYFDKDLASNQITYFVNGAIAGNATETTACGTANGTLLIGNGNSPSNNVPYNGIFARPLIMSCPTVDAALSIMRNEFARFR